MMNVSVCGLPYFSIGTFLEWTTDVLIPVIEFIFRLQL